MTGYIPYVSPRKGNYFVDSSGYLGEISGTSPEEKIEAPIGIRDIGQTVTEGGRFGSLIQTTQQAIKFGTGKIELQVQQGGGGEPVGAENYGQDARQALRELAKVNQVDFTSVHAPTNVGNLSGFSPQQQGFSEQQRAEGLEEIKKAIKFASDVTKGGAVVVHTGEYWRDMSDMKWNENPVTISEKDKKKATQDKDGKVYEFLSYPDEYKNQAHYLVDSRTGKLIQDVRKNMIVHEAKYKKDENGRYVDEYGNPLEYDYLRFEKGVPVVNEKTGQFETEPLKWENFKEMADEYNKYGKKPGERDKTAAEMFMRTKLQTQIKQSKGMSLHYSENYSKINENLNKINEKKQFLKSMDEKNLSDEEKIRLLISQGEEFGIDPASASKAIREGKTPSQYIEDEIEKNLRIRREEITGLSSTYATNAAEAEMNLKTIEPISEYAKRKSMESYAELGIEAMEESNRKDIEKPIFIAPENIFPEMGYGSHPEELIELVTNAREKMIERLTSKYIEEKDPATGDVEKRINPNYRGISKKQAEEEAKEHIKATVDTQHLGMWWKHFQPMEGETYDQRRERFNEWYKKMIEKMQEKEIIGHMHLVDSLGSGHHHLPAGQGNLPLYEAIEHLKEKGYKGTIVSEAHGEESFFGQGRIMTETWKHFGSTIGGYGAPAPNPSFGSVSGGYFSQLQSPYFTFGSYVPSNEWKLWSEVPFE